MEGKVCSKCGVWKPLEEYYKKKGSKDGRRSACKECYKESCKRWRENNIEYRKEYEKQWRENNKEYTKEYQKQWRENNPEYKKQWRENNKEQIKEQIKQWRENNKEQIKEYNKKLKETRYYKKYFENNTERYHECDKKSREKRKESNLQHISSIVEQINPIFKQLDLPIYGYVYMFENVKTRHKYVGQSILPITRRYGLEGGIIKSWIKERLEKTNQKFKEELIEEDIVVTETLDIAFCQYHLDKLEAYYINKHDSYNDGYNNNAGYHSTDDGIDEFNQILSEYNLEFVDGKLIENKNAYRSKH
jgi:hypothetical protein